MNNETTCTKVQNAYVYDEQSKIWTRRGDFEFMLDSVNGAVFAVGGCLS